MAFSRVSRCSLVLVSLALFPAVSLGMDSVGSYCAGNSYAGNSKAVASINYVLADLVATASTGGGFATSSAGKGDKAVYGLAQCRGDVSAPDCAACLADAAKQLPGACRYSSDARTWYDYCFVRYASADDFVGRTDTDAGVILVNVQAVDSNDTKAFERAVGKVMGRVAAQASAAGSGGLGRDRERYTPFVSVYGLAQCTRDLAPLACAQCVATAVSRFGQYCGAQQGCQINYSSCRVRYEIYPFYFPLVDGAGGRAAATDMTRYNKIVVHA